MKNLLLLYFLVVTLGADAATILDLTENVAPSDGTMIEVADPLATPKSGKYALTNFATRAQLDLTAPISNPDFTGTMTLNGSSIETQLTNRVLKAGDTMQTLTVTALTNSALTPFRVLISAADKSLASSSVTDTELSYLSGIGSSIATQLTNKVEKTLATSQGMSGALTGPSSTWTNGITAGASTLTTLTANGITNLQIGTNTTWLVFEGDSMTSGYGTATQSYPYALTNSFLTNSWIISKTNVAVAGETAAAMVTQYATQVAPMKPDASHDSVLFVWGGLNDTLTTAAPAIWASLTNLWGLARADGFKVVAFTLPGSINATIVARQRSQDVNTLIRQSDTLYDFLVDVDMVFPTTVGCTVDGVHLTNDASRYLAKVIMDVLSRQPTFDRSSRYRANAAGNFLDISNDDADFFFYRNNAWAARITGKYPLMLFEDQDQTDAFAIFPYGGQTELWWKDGTGNMSSSDRYQSFGTTGVTFYKSLILSDAITGTSGTVEVRNGSTAQQQSWFDTYTDASNFRNATWGWQKNANAFTLTTTNAGTAAGTGGSIIFAPLGTTALTVNTNGSASVGATYLYSAGVLNTSALNFYPSSAAQAVYQMSTLGMAVGSTRWIGWSPTATANGASIDLFLSRSAAGVLNVQDANLNYGVVNSGGLQAGWTKVLTDATATSAFYLSVPNTNALGGEVFWTVSATDGTETQQQTGRTQFGAVGKSTTVTADLTTRTNAAQVSAGTLTVDVIKNVATNNVFALQFNADTSLTTTNLVLKWRLETPSSYTVNSL